MISVILRLILVLGFAWLLWRCGARRVGFRAWLGLYRPTRRALAAAALGMVPLAALALVPIPDLHRLYASQTDGTWPALVVGAWVHSSLVEEIIFRGLIAKRLQSNAAQAAIFGAAHALYLAANLPGASLAAFAYAFAFPFAAGLAFFYVNERVGNGSLAPSWAMHAAINTVVALAYHLNP